MVMHMKPGHEEEVRSTICPCAGYGKCVADEVYAGLRSRSSASGCLLSAAVRSRSISGAGCSPALSVGTSTLCEVSCLRNRYGMSDTHTEFGTRARSTRHHGSLISYHLRLPGSAVLSAYATDIESPVPRQYDVPINVEYHVAKFTGIVLSFRHAMPDTDIVYATTRR
eukprot:3933139-Rhodomonas_salina.3